MEYRWQGREIQFNDDSIRLTKVLSRHQNHILDECVIVVLGENGVKEPLIAKLRVELDSNPVTYDSDNGSEIDDSSREVAKSQFERELAALKELEGSGHTPHLRVHGVIEQDRSMPCPGGYIRALIMSKIPGQNVKEILLDLNEDERVMIETQLAEVLEYMRQKGWSFIDPKPSNLHWDGENKKLYLIDLGGAIPAEKTEKIEPQSGIVQAFRITSQYSRRSQR
ncbi:MAG: hypothetical protein M1840_006328 [Geoglossum simile]|nr:MAG: hypothetical protein M1840_006328 [Geoglossum simile]